MERALARVLLVSFPVRLTLISRSRLLSSTMTHFTAVIRGLNSRPDDGPGTGSGRARRKDKPRHLTQTGQVKLELDIPSQAGIAQTGVGADDVDIGHGGDQVSDDHLEQELSGLARTGTPG